MSNGPQEKLNALATRYGVSVGAVEVLAAALRISGGKLAQFSHPELGGTGQWMPGMIMIGDMFNTSLKARVDGLATELSRIMAADTTKPGMGNPNPWWPSAFGTPSTTGSQNDLHYAYFVTSNRLLINRDGHVTTYDTTGYRVTGVSQQQSNGVQIIVFHSINGVANVATLPVVL